VINTIAKLVRIRGIGPWLSRGLLKFRRTASNELLVQQLKEVPNGGHDDGPDALAGALKLLLRLLGDAFEQNVTESLA
jgi:phage terminase large subunit-like protein